MSSVCVKGSPGALNWNWTGSHIKNCWWFWFWLFPREVAGINSVSLERCISINGQEQTDCGDTNQNCLWFKNFCFPINRSWERGATGFPILFLLRDGTTLKSKLTAATQIRTFLFITKKKSLVQHEVDDNAEEDLKRFLCYWRDRERSYQYDQERTTSSENINNKFSQGEETSWERGVLLLLHPRVGIDVILVRLSVPVS